MRPNGGSVAMNSANPQIVDEIMEVDVAVASIIFLSPGTEASVEYYEPCWAGKDFLPYHAMG